MGRKPTLLVPLTFGIAFFLGVESGGFQLVLLQVAEEFALAPVKMGGVVTSQFIAIVMGPLLFGWVSDRIGKKTILLYGMIVFIVGCFGAALSPAVVFFTCCVFILGLGFSVCECIGSSFLSDSFPGKESAYLNIMQCAFSLGAVLSPLVFSRLMLAGFISWRTVFWAAGGGYALIYPLLILSRGTRPFTESAGTQKKVLPSVSEPAAERAAASEAPGVFSPFFIILVFSMVICVAVEAGIGYFADSLFVTEFNNTKMGAYAISGFWFSMAVSRFVFSRIKMKPQTMVMLGFLSICLLLLFSLPFRKANILLAAFFFLGFATGPVWPMIVGIGASLNQKRSGTSVSILTAFGGLGGMIMPVLIGLIAEWKGFFNSFWLLAIFSALGFLIMRLGTRKRKT